MVLISIVVVKPNGGAIPWSGDQHLMAFGGKFVCMSLSTSCPL